MYKIVRKYNIPENSIVDFSSNINPAGYPRGTGGIIKKSIKSIVRYPDPDCTRLRNGLSGVLGVSPGNIAVGNGAIEFIYLIPQMLGVKRALIPVPSFNEYEASVKIQNGKCIFFRTHEEKNYKLDVDALKKRIPGVDLVFICNPNNPTGSILNKDELLYILKACRMHGVFLCIDEVFIDFADDIKGAAVPDSVRTEKNVLLVRSMTKLFAIPGLRLGYLVSGRETIDRINDCRPPWSVNTLAQSVASELLKDKEFVQRSRECVRREKDFLTGCLKNIKGIEPFPSQANFILCKLKAGRMNSRRLSEKLARKGILIRDCSDFRGLNEKFIRLAVKGRKENQMLVGAMKKALGGA
ncbi:MAG: threonine-phosphate decarboxylase CobD [Elusimicrobia bacterium]|nr:threonine-phosphate decarboxylase CobD [Elusimicrobiota bacterium]